MPPKLSPSERIKLIERIILKGESVSQACQKAGISRTLFYRWLRRYKKEGKITPKKRVPVTPRQVPEPDALKIIGLVLAHPDWSTKKISQGLPKIDGKPLIGNHGVQNVLERLDLNVFEKRERFAGKAKGLNAREALRVVRGEVKLEAAKELTPLQRLDMMERVVKYKEPVAKVCLDFNISRPNFYKWLKRYQEAPEDKKLEALQAREPKVERYYRQTPEKYEEAVLSVVATYPELGVGRIVKALPQIAGEPIVGHHGVQNVLRRHDLTTYEKRLAYAQAQATLVIRLISILRELGTRFIILPAETRVKLVRFASIAFVSAFLTTVGLGLFGYMATVFGQAPTTGSRIGLFFASVALSVGSVFFAYSMKYYLTLALVLSFSRQSLEEGGGFIVGLNGKLNGGNGRNGPSTGLGLNGNGGVGGWLGRIFGLGNGSNGMKGQEGRIGGNGGNGMMPGGGLQPSLDHIKLKRYPFFSIHLPFYNEKKVAERILNACTSMDYPNYEVIVCDDSTDETVEIVQRYAEDHNQKHPHGPKIKILHRPTREGFKGGALSYALKNMNPRTELICVFDADFIPYPDTLEQFAKYFRATGGWQENQAFRANQVRTIPYDTFKKIEISSQEQKMLASQVEQLKTKSSVACVAGYQWHVLNKSENWITRGVRTEYAGSYVIERPGQEILGAFKIIHGSVYCIRADVLKHFGWGTSITEDFELTLRIYEKGFKVVYTPYVQAPSECVATLKRLIRQRMRWAEGHSFNVKKMFRRLLVGRWAATKHFIPSPLTLMEKLEFLYLSPYYLQAFFFMVGTLSWLISETVFPARLPFWTSLWGWSLVLTNFFALPLVNAVGMFLEESEEKDYLGLLSFVFLSYLLVPFQAYASVKGFIEKEEGPWFRTPKTGRITDIFTRGRFYRWVSGILPVRRPAVVSTLAGKVAPAYAEARVGGLGELGGLGNRYLALATANNQFNSFRIRRRTIKGAGKIFIVFLLIFSLAIGSMAIRVPTAEAAVQLLYTHGETTDGTDGWPNIASNFHLDTTFPNQAAIEICGKYQKDPAGTIEQVGATTGCAAAGTGEPDGGAAGGYFTIAQSGIYPSGTWSFDIRLRNTLSSIGGTPGNYMFFIKVFSYVDSAYQTKFYSVYQNGTCPGACVTTCQASKPDRTGGTAIAPSGTAYVISWNCTGAPAIDLGVNGYLHVQYFYEIHTASNGPQADLLFIQEGSGVTGCGTLGQGCTKIQTTDFAIPETAWVALPLVPLLPKVAEGLPAIWRRILVFVRRKRRKE